MTFIFSYDRTCGEPGQGASPLDAARLTPGNIFGKKKQAIALREGTQ